MKYKLKMKELSVGMELESNNYGKYIIEEIISYKKIKIKFIENVYSKYVQIYFILAGKIKNPYHPIIYGVGYLGDGIYSKKIHSRIYNVWINMLNRCYGETRHYKYPSYIGCSVDPLWHNFQTFCSDYLNMIGNNITSRLDKDILFKNNKIYSKDTCILVNHKINCLLITGKSLRGEYVIGVRKKPRERVYYSGINISGKLKHLGTFFTELEAFNAYKQAKEDEIKRVANLYKDELDPRAYQALMNYQVEITD